ncbi:MAG TPA: thioredoxin domain-containing protein [Terriglobales bacterium]|jgi:protein-disulfide isomerase|nr:thioredoxin domain-containing protein [Terriglobales bacterium]
MRNHLMISTLLALSLIAVAQQKPAANAPPPAQLGTHATPNLPSEDEVNAFMHETFGYDPQLTWKIVGIKPGPAEGLSEVTVHISGPQGQGDQKFYVTEDGKHAVVGDVIPFGAHPFEQTRELLRQKATGPSRGPASAPVTVVEFSDLQCPHCKEAAPTIDKLLTDNPNIHFILQSFPLPMHNWAMKGAEYADCVGKASNEAFWKFISNVYAAQSEITAENADQKLTEIADSSGVNGKEIAACAAKPETQSRVEASINLGKSVDVNATPTLFINGRPVGVTGNNYEVLKQIVDFAANDK